ncbi:Uncharacterised protein [Mycobacteroides abscessus subsp. abscessus]|nr:Uncharacterised protein [Mycobacteroides abscessus subsp. abscessus]
MCCSQKLGRIRKVSQRIVRNMFESFRIGVGDHGDEGGAVSFQTGKVFVAGRLINPRLTAELRGYGLHGQAIGLLAAIATTFTNSLIDKDPLRGLRYQPPLTFSA